MATYASLINFNFMKVSFNWLNDRFFKGNLPSPETVAESLTLGAFEIESVEDNIVVGDRTDTVLDAKILPNRSHDCLSHKGIAREIATLLGEKVSYTPDTPKTSSAIKTADMVSVTIDERDLCARAMKRVVMGVKVGPSPEWLAGYLTAVGVKPINNVVDSANFVMLETGQPVHTFDLDKISGNLSIRRAEPHESIVALDGNTYTLDPSTLVIADEKKALDIAGIKGGAESGIDHGTKNVLLSACNFNPVSIRLSSKKLGLRTDASHRFENGITAELIPEAIELLSALVQATAGGDVTEDILDVYPQPEKPYVVGVSPREVEAVLGIALSEKDISNLLDKAGFSHVFLNPIEYIVDRAEKLVGAKYTWGASVRRDAPELFDCSSFTAYLYAQAGIAIPRMSVDQFLYGTPVALGDIQPGDLLFFSGHSPRVHRVSVEWMPGTAVKEGVGHVALYCGNDTMIHARGEDVNMVVKESFSTSALRAACVGARRIPWSNERRFVVTPPAERLDIRLTEDVVEEIALRKGLNAIAVEKISPIKKTVAPHKTPFYTNHIRKLLADKGFSEVYTYAFANHGHVDVANPIASNKKALRQALAPAFSTALGHNATRADLLGLDMVCAFEIGTIFHSSNPDGEVLSLAVGARLPGANPKTKIPEEKVVATLNMLAESLGIASDTLHKKNIIEDGSVIAEVDLTALFSTLPEPKAYTHDIQLSSNLYKKFSPYPFIVRDIAVFVPVDTGADDVLNTILPHLEHGALLVHYRLFDRFEKKFPDGSTKISYAFRFVFQSSDRTLADDEVHTLIGKATEILNSTPDWQVR